MFIFGIVLYHIFRRQTFSPRRLKKYHDREVYYLGFKKHVCIEKYILEPIK